MEGERLNLGLRQLWRKGGFVCLAVFGVADFDWILDRPFLSQIFYRTLSIDTGSDKDSLIAMRVDTLSNA